MSPERPQPLTHLMPIASIDDPRTITLLTTEHWSLLSARSLAYNEAFVRAGMFLTFLSMSFGRDFLSVAALVLAFDFVVGLTTFLRMNGANLDDLRAVHGMARIRHAYTQITPLVTPYFTTPTHDGHRCRDDGLRADLGSTLGPARLWADDLERHDRPHCRHGRGRAGHRAGDAHRPGRRRLDLNRRGGRRDRPCRPVRLHRSDDHARTGPIHGPLPDPRRRPGR